VFLFSLHKNLIFKIDLTITKLELGKAF